MTRRRSPGAVTPPVASNPTVSPDRPRIDTATYDQLNGDFACERDAAIAIGPTRYPTLWWRDGAVLGRTYGDDLEGLTRFARRVDAKIE